jgi:hypothetical protein
MLYKQSVVKFSYKYGVTNAAIKFKKQRRTIYRWREKYDGTLESLRNKSRRPHHHPKEHTKEEKELIRKYKSNNKKTRVSSIMGEVEKGRLYKNSARVVYSNEKNGNI